MAREEFVLIGVLLIVLAVGGYFIPMPFTLAGETSSNTIPNVVAFCESGLGQFAQLSPEIVKICSEFNTLMLGIYGSGLLGIILIIVGAVKGDSKEKILHVDTGEVEERSTKEHDKSIDILKERYAKGEITKEEFVNMKNDLGGNMPIQNYKPEKKAEPKEDIQYKSRPERNLKKSPILKGVIIGIILIVIFWGIYGLALSQTFYMINDALSPDVMKGDLMHYQRTPFNEIKVGDIIAFIPSDKVEFETMVGIVRIIGTGSYVQTSNNVNPNTLSSVFEKDYVGKIISVTSQGWISTVYSSPYHLLVITAVLFVIPIVIMKIREKNPENS